MPYFYIFAFLIGLCVGSFLNALIFRMRAGQSAWRGRSRCPHCQKTLRWRELVPIVSFVIQRGRCLGCKKKIDWQYPLVELATGLLFALFFSNINLLVYWFIASVLVFLFVYDLRYGEIPDKVTLPAITLLLVFWLINYWVTGYRLQVIGLGVLIGGGFFALQYFISRGRWVGGGDIRLGILMGLILGWPKILIALSIAYVGGALICLPLLILKKKTLQSAVPFGVFLIPATLVAMFWGQKIVEWYLR